MRKNLYVLFAAFVLGSLALAACGGAAAEAPASAEPAAPVAELASDDPMEVYAPYAVDGDIVLAGSSTVFPLAERMIERFAEEGFDGNATYDSIGSGGGFERFCVNGETDISGASRGIKDSEVESCAAIGRTPIEFRVGTDALSVVVSKDNTFATDATTRRTGSRSSAPPQTGRMSAPSGPLNPSSASSPAQTPAPSTYFVEDVFDEDEEPYPGRFQHPTLRRRQCPRPGYAKAVLTPSASSATLTMPKMLTC